MTIEIETRAYEFAHGKKPRGIGHWAFDLTNQHDRTETIWAPGQMTSARPRSGRSRRGAEPAAFAR